MNRVLFSLKEKVLPENLQPSLSPENSYLGPLSKLSSLLIFGEHAATFLQGQLTYDINQLTPKQASLGAYCDHKGRVIANFWIWQQDSLEYGLLLPDSMIPIVQQHLKKYVLFSKVNIEPNPNYSAWLYCIPKMKTSVLTLGNTIVTGELPSSFPSHCLNWLIGDVDELANLKSQEAHQIDILDTQNCELLHLLAGYDFIYPATSMLFTPQMLNLEKLGAVSFRKGCYVGQEVIARTQNLGKLKRHLYFCLIEQGDAPALGTEIINQNKEVMGVLFSLVNISTDNYLALAVIQDQAQETNLHINQQPLKILKLA